VSAGDERERLALLVHEVRSPTAALAAIAAAIAGDDLDEDSTRELLRLAVAACHGIERIVTDAALGPLRVEDVDVRAVAQAAVASAALTGAPVRLVTDSNLPQVRGDTVRLRQAIDNLLANAIAHSPPGEEVVVVVASGEHETSVAVSDRGPGVPLEDQERIFDPGVRLDSEHAGSGLGLTIARAIAEAHGGTLIVVSEPGHGATFTLTVPRPEA
jgi:two-component system sensor histidine kinase BaeS